MTDEGIIGPPQTPSVGRIVHVATGDQAQPCEAAIVTAAWPDDGLFEVNVFRATGNLSTALLGGSTSQDRLNMSADGVGRDWHWPERA